MAAALAIAALMPRGSDWILCPNGFPLEMKDSAGPPAFQITTKGRCKRAQYVNEDRSPTA